MSKLSQSIIDTPLELANEPSGQDVSPAQLEAEDKASRAEAERAFAIWGAKNTLLGKVWNIEAKRLNGLTYSAVYISDTKPDNMEALALIFTVYRYNTPAQQAVWIKELENRSLFLSIAPAYLWEYDDIKHNHIPF